MKQEFAQPLAQQLGAFGDAAKAAAWQQLHNERVAARAAQNGKNRKVN